MSETGHRAPRLRSAILFGLLALMLFAWWYDWKVARPKVDSAWDRVAELNEKFNAKASDAMLNLDVQQALQRKPTRTMTVGPYQVEVFSWVAGLPFRTHDYYAVYTPRSGKLVFATHFKFSIPREELEVKEEPRPKGPVVLPGPPMGAPAPGGPPGAPRGKRKPADRGDDSGTKPAAEERKPADHPEPADQDAGSPDAPAAAPDAPPAQPPAEPTGE